MDFEISEGRRMLADSLGRFLSDQYGITHRNKMAYEAPFHDPSKWNDLAELGVLYALAPEDRGGFGGTGFDVVTVFEQLGRALCPEPILPQLLAARLLLAAQADLEPLLSGGTRYGVAMGEVDAPYALDGITTEAVKSGASWQITGRKSVVYGAQAANTLLVAARHAGGLGVFRVASDDARITPYGMIDGGGAGEVFLDHSPATLTLDTADTALQDALDWGALALSAEAVGAMDTANALLIDYLKTRKQFGRPIGTFQALQHRAVDLAIEIEQARSITILAASRMGTGLQSRTVSMAKNLIGRTAKLVAEDSIQMQGGIAMTWEYPASHYAKRLIMIDHQLGDTDTHLERVMAGLQSTP
ncbi:acyl-CoA dehydrogenase [Rhodophyticola sp. CCM32]|uniref:acyl-CoA dehydrogenase family protein n=1 Tax=Rhodophyticola sp. CCM32 TaxID=2916397 RepID=UPI00107F6586|nr:acyl-CoA dehydrogenase family protein [Rhodophyticola sp. CCM32]QBX99352.1 acyl-CoA dehydrogenase [Rhodophyticola sp. CCM32]